MAFKNPLASRLEEARKKGGGITPTVRDKEGNVATTTPPKPKTKAEMQGEARERVLVRRGKLRTQGVKPGEEMYAQAEARKLSSQNKRSRRNSTGNKRSPSTRYDRGSR